MTVRSGLLECFSQNFADIVVGRSNVGFCGSWEVDGEQCKGGKISNYCRALDSQGGEAVCMAMQVFAMLSNPELFGYESHTNVAAELLNRYFGSRRGPGRVTPDAVRYCQARCTPIDWDKLRTLLDKLSLESTRE